MTQTLAEAVQATGWKLFDRSTTVAKARDFLSRVPATDLNALYVSDVGLVRGLTVSKATAKVAELLPHQVCKELVENGLEMEVLECARSEEVTSRA